MEYVKITAKTYQDAMNQLRLQYGEDAIPISHKYVKEGGFFGSKLLAKEVVQLTAGVQNKKPNPKGMSYKKSSVDFTVGDSDKDNSKKYKSTMKDLIDKTVANSSNEINMESLNKTIDALNDNLNGFNSENSLLNAPADSKIENTNSKIETVDKEIKSNSVTSFEKEFNEIKNKLNMLVKEQGKTFENNSQNDINKDEDLLKPFIEILKDNDFNSDECSSIICEVKNSISKEDLKDKYKIEKSLKELLKSRIVTTGPIKMGNKKKIMMFVGPTGVGKTTTMAKLGALHSLREGNKVVFITIDNYRIAATEQLKKYAEIMRIPVYAVNDQKEFKEVIAREKAEIILVDTSGRSHRNELKISEIKSFADIVDYDFEKVLCVSANTKKRDLDDVFKAFNVMDLNSIVITKVDETSFIGNVIDIADKYKKPISYYTNGQEVPNDIEVANSDKIVDMIIGNMNN